MINRPVQIDDCFVHDKDRLKHEDALDILKQRLTSIVENETISCGDALGRVVAQDIVAPHPVPLHTNSAVDGYAFRHSDFQGDPLPRSAKIAAGELSPAPLKGGTVVRIFTGAPMPLGADTVAMQEDCVTTGDQILLPEGLKPGANCRRAGEDLSEGDVVLTKSDRLDSADLAALASIGIARVSVFKKLSIALFSTGDEMRDPSLHESSLRPGEVYDANRPLLKALCGRLPAKINDGGILEDDATKTQNTIRDASFHHDIIITTGGASKGSEDHMLTTLDALGKRHLWQLAVKPGRPMMFGQIKRDNDTNCMFFGLPGNPVAAMVCFLLYVQPALLLLAGGKWHVPHRFQVPAGFAIKNKKPDRREFLRGALKVDVNGKLSVEKYDRDGSGLISSLRESDGLIEVPEGTTSVQHGTPVSFIPFSSF